ncbi:MAG: hypothetical protein CL765_06560 [Chloroflexi bacterium]|nr:hypothetical protein [Chloroflexota bacterium]
MLGSYRDFTHQTIEGPQVSNLHSGQNPYYFGGQSENRFTLLPIQFHLFVIEGSWFDHDMMIL